MLTQNGKVIHPSDDPSGVTADIETELITQSLGDCAADGPRINLCWSCALKIGRDLIEDGALCRSAHTEYSNQKSYNWPNSNDSNSQH